MSNRWGFFVCWCLLATVVQAAATNRYVSLNGGNAIPYDSWANAGTSLKTVVDYANTKNEGDIVWVSNGAYTLAATIAVQNTIVKSFNTNVAGTSINGAGTYACFTLNNSNAWLEGLTISNGYLSSGGGAGVYLINGGTVTNCTVYGCYALGTYSSGGGVMISTGLVVNCAIVSNRSFSEGGGVYINSGPSTLRNCFIANNTTGRGGAISSSGGSILVDNCVIVYNLTTNPALNYGGGGIYGGGVVTNCRIYGNTSASTGGGITGGLLLQNCLVSNNVAGIYGGGIGCYYGNGPVVNCTIVDNMAASQGGGIWAGFSGGIVSNCTIIGNTSSNGGGAYFYCPYYAGGLDALYNCLIANNVATNSGGGVVLDFFATYNPMTFQNCTVVSNTALGASGIGGIRGMSMGVTASFVNVIAYFNVGASASNWASAGAKLLFSNSCVAPTGGTYYIGAKTIATDPLFLSPASGNYLLIKGSPCINTGMYQDWMTNAVDLDGRPRIRQGAVDMGAYEYFPMGSVFAIY